MFCFGPLLNMRPTLECVWYTKWHFFFLRKLIILWQIISWLSLGLFIYFPCLELKLFSDLNLYRCYVYYDSVSEFLYMSTQFIWKTLFPWSHPPLLTLIISPHTLPHTFPSLSTCLQGLWKYKFRAVFSKVSQSFHIVHLWIVLLISIYSMTKVLSWGLDLIYAVCHK